MNEPRELPRGQRMLVLVVAFLALVFDGVELGLMPVASLSVSKSLLGSAFTPTLGGDWFARFTAALMLGAAIGGIVLGSLGDRIGRTRAMGISVIFYSAFAALGAAVQSQEQMLVLRFLVGLGVGGLEIARLDELHPVGAVAAGPARQIEGGGAEALGLLLRHLEAHGITPDPRCRGPAPCSRPWQAQGLPGLA